MSGQDVPSPGAVPTTGRDHRHALRSVESSLGATARAARRLLLTREVAWLLGLAAAGAFSLGFIDYLARLPWWLRSLALVAGVGGLGILFVRQVLPAWRFRPSLTDLALRFEQTAQGARLKGLLASAIDLSKHPSEGEPALTEGAIDEALTAYQSVGGARSLLKPSGVRNRVLLAVACLAPAAIVAIWNPSLAVIGTGRVLTPWRGVEWPKRYAITDATGLSAAALGNSVPLKAVVYRTDRPTGKTDVWVKYRLITDGAAGPVQRAALTGQGRTVSAPLSVNEDVKGELYERLIDPGAKSASESTTTAVQTPSRAAVEYWFEAHDDRTAARRIELVEPPAVVSAEASIQPPEYAAHSAPGAQAKPAFASGTEELGPGRDERASVGPILTGSRIELMIKLNKPLTVPAPVASAFPGVELPGDATLTADGASWLLKFTAENALRLPVALEDEHGIRNVADTAYQFQIVPDRPPAAAIVDPAQDESVLPTAILDVTGEARDDVGIASVAIELQLASVPSGSAGAPAEPKGDRSVLTSAVSSSPER
jgi:hypothetical protein